MSGFAELIGGVLGYLIIRKFINDFLIGIIFALIAGIMVFISFDGLLPSAEKYGNHHLAILGVVLGMIVMAISLLLF